MRKDVTETSPLSCDSFVFSPENEAKLSEILGRYPPNHQASAILPLFELAQRQCGGWLPPAAIKTVTEMLSVPLVRGYEVATFYTLFNLEPVGKYHIQMCGTPPCMLRGSNDLLAACKRTLGIECGQTTKDGLFTLTEVECLAACTGAPALQINDTTYENLTEDSLCNLLKELAAC